MDPTLLTKVLAGTVGLACIMVLALAGKVDGPTAASAVQTITGVFLGSAAALGIGQHIASAFRRGPPVSLTTPAASPAAAKTP